MYLRSLLVREFSNTTLRCNVVHNLESSYLQAIVCTHGSYVFRVNKNRTKLCVFLYHFYKTVIYKIRDDTFKENKTKRIKCHGIEVIITILQRNFLGW